MSERFSVEPLAQDQIAQAFPLVRMVAPGMTLPAWREHVLAYLHPVDRKGAAPLPRGMCASLNRAGYIHGLFSYWVEEEAGRPRRLLVEHFIAFDLLARADLVATMLSALDELACEHACAAIHTRISDGDDTLLVMDGNVLAWFDDSGHRRDGAGLAKILE